MPRRSGSRIQRCALPVALILAALWPGAVTHNASLAGTPAGPEDSRRTHHVRPGHLPGPADSPDIEELKPLPELNQHPEILLREAFRAEIAGDNKEALEAYRRFLEQGHDSAHVRASYGRLLAINRRPDDALRELDRAIQLKPDNSDYAILKAEVLRQSGRSEAALEFLNGVLYDYEDDPGIEFLLGELYFEAREYTAAQAHHKRTLIHLKRAGSRGVTYRSVSLWRLADLNLRNNRLESARDYLVQYLRHNPRRHYPRYILADRVYFQLGQFKEARRELESLLQSDPAELVEQGVDIKRTYGLLARIYYLYEDVRFVSTVQLAAAYSQDNQAGIVERALLLAHRGQHREALRYLLPIVQRQENTVLIPWVAILRIVEQSERPELYVEQLAHVAAVAQSFGQHHMALGWLRTALAGKASHPGAAVSVARIEQVMAAHYEALGQDYRASLHLDRAVRAARAIVSEEAEDAAEMEDMIVGLLLTRAAILGKRTIGQYTEALALCDQAGQRSAASATRGEIEHNRGNLPAAESAFDLALQQNAAEARRQQTDARIRRILGTGRQAQARYYFMRAVVRYDRENMEGAIKDLELALEAHEGETGFGVALNFLSYLYARENRDMEQARRLIDRALETSPVNGHYVDTLAWIYYRQGELKKARYQAAFAARLLEEDADAEGGEPEILDHLGDILRDLKRPGEAQSAYRRARILLEQRQKRPGRRNFGVHEEALLEALREKLRELQSLKKSDNRFARTAVQ